jgi:hypothetical protein
MFRLSLERLVSIAIAAAAIACGDGGENVRDGLAQPVSGGEAVVPGAWPNVVLLDSGCSGVVVTSDLVLFAAHCGVAATAWFGDEFELAVQENDPRVVVTPLGAARAIELTDCKSIPDAALASGADLAYCLLSEPIARELVAPIALGCERDALQTDRATLVGFGVETEGGVAGIKRVTESEITAFGNEIRIGSAEAGGCRGDSGSPAFVRAPSSAAASGEWRVLGVLSSGIRGEDCGVGYYTDASRWIDWLEDQSGRDLGTCFGRELVWSPTPRCTVPALDALGLPGATVEAVPSQTCGAPFDAGAPDALRPRILGARVDALDEPAVFRVSVAAEDVGWGIEDVFAELLSVERAPLASARDEVPPYSFDFSRIEGATSVRFTARDFAGGTDQLEQPLSGRPASGTSSACGVHSVSGRPARAEPWLMAALFCAGAAGRSQRERRRAAQPRGRRAL